MPRRSRTTRSTLALRAGMPFSLTAVRDADPVPRDAQLQRRHLRAGSVAREAADAELRRAPRHAEGQRRCAGHCRPGPFTPARNFDAIENVPNWKDIDPRFGIAYDLFGDGKTAIKAQHRPLRRRRVVHHRARGQPGAVHGEQRDAHVGAAGRRDLHRHLQPVRRLRPDQPGGQQQASGRRSAAAPSATRRSARWRRGTTNYDPAIVDGWHVRPNNWEMQFSIQRELMPRVSVYAGYTRRWLRQPVRHAEPERDQRRLHAVLRPGAGRRPRCRHGGAAVRPLRRQPHHRGQQPDLQLEQRRAASTTSTTASTST